MPDLNMKGKNSDRALVHLDASIYFYLKWGGSGPLRVARLHWASMAYHQVSDMAWYSNSCALHIQLTNIEKVANAKLPESICGINQKQWRGTNVNPANYPFESPVHQVTGEPLKAGQFSR